MRRLVLVFAFSLVAGSVLAQIRYPILLRDMGSFHIGGRFIEITGQPIKEVVFTPGGVPAKMDPNGKYQVEQMYVQYLDRKSTRLNSSHITISYAVFCLKKKNEE